MSVLRILLLIFLFSLSVNIANALDSVGVKITVSTLSVTNSCTLPGGKTMDLDGSGVVDRNDAILLSHHWNTAWFVGDLNNDGIVNIIDASILAVHWNTACREK